MKLFINIYVALLLLILLGICPSVIGQSSIVSPQKSFIRVLDNSDLPDFSQAIQINRCTKTGSLGFNVNLDDMDILPSQLFPGSLYPITIAEHLKHLPKSGLHITQYYIHQGQLLENNFCPSWQTWTFDETGIFHINLMFFVDTLFVIRSDESPSCEVIIWIRPQQIPIGRAAFFRCIN